MVDVAGLEPAKPGSATELHALFSTLPIKESAEIDYCDKE